MQVQSTRPPAPIAGVYVSTMLLALGDPVNTRTPRLQVIEAVLLVADAMFTPSQALASTALWVVMHTAVIPGRQMTNFVRFAAE